jgi:hypothetical protein
VADRERNDATGSNSPKGSTPIAAGWAQVTNGRRTSGATTPKGSMPISGAASVVPYVLSAEPALLARYADQLLEVKGARTSADTGTMQVLQVANVRVLAASCGQ